MSTRTIKTSELTGAALDWAVAKAEGMTPHAFVERDYGQCAHRALDRWCGIHVSPGGHTVFAPSTDWAQGGPRIERERISVTLCHPRPSWASVDTWSANTNRNDDIPGRMQYGSTPLIAAMRCFVASKLGDTVEVPEELLA